MLTTPLPLTFKGWLELYVSEILSESSNSYVFSEHRKRSFGVRNSESKLGFFCSDEQRILWMGFSSENTSEQACFLYYNGMADPFNIKPLVSKLYVHIYCFEYVTLVWDPCDFVTYFQRIRTVYNGLFQVQCSSTRENSYAVYSIACVFGHCCF